MAVQISNRKSCQSLRGGAVIVTLDATESISKLPYIVEGDRAGLVSTPKFGLVAEVDYEGYSFKINPYMPTGNLASASTPGYLTVDELININ